MFLPVSLHSSHLISTQVLQGTDWRQREKLSTLTSQLLSKFPFNLWQVCINIVLQRKEFYSSVIKAVIISIFISNYIAFKKGRGLVGMNYTWHKGT